MDNDQVIIFRDNSPLVAVEIENGIFLSNELLDWYAEVYDFERSKLTCAVVQTIKYNIDEDEVRKRYWDEYHARQASYKNLMASDDEE